MAKYNQENIVYSQFLSSLFSSISVMGLSLLCLLNNLSLDFYSLVFLLKVIIPAGVSTWILGFATGKILDSYQNKIENARINNEKQAYEIPSMFSDFSNANPDTNSTENSLLDIGDL